MAFISASTLSGLTYKDASPNMRANSWLRSSYSGGSLTGYSAIGSCSIAAVSPYTKGFEGPYTPTIGSATAANLDSATASTPFWYGVFNIGPRMGRGGMTGGFGGTGDGNLLKITSSAGASKSYYDGCQINLTAPVKRNQLRFRAWVWCESGTYNQFSISLVDTGTTIVIPNYNTWTYVDAIIGMSQVTDVDCRINWRYESSPLAVELYFAQINITLPENTGDLSQHPSTSL